MLTTSNYDISGQNISRVNVEYGWSKLRYAIDMFHKLNIKEALCKPGAESITFDL